MSDDFAIEGFDLNLLRSLHALLVTHSVSAAASSVGVTQPAMSASLAKLRTHLGDPLLVRRGNRMLPTPRAERLAAPVARAMEAVRSALNPTDATFDPAVERTFSIATTDEVVAALGPPILRDLAESAPASTILFKALDESYNVESLELGTLDAVITVDWTAPAQLKKRRLYTDSFVCVAPRRRRFERCTNDIEAYAAARHLLVAPFGGSAGPVDLVLEDHGLRRNVAVVTPSFLTVPHFLFEGDGLVCTLPARAAAAVTQGTRALRFEPPISLPPVRYDLFWHQRVHIDAVHRWMRLLLAKLASRL